MQAKKRWQCHMCLTSSGQEMAKVAKTCSPSHLVARYTGLFATMAALRRASRPCILESKLSCTVTFVLAKLLSGPFFDGVRQGDGASSPDTVRRSRSVVRVLFVQSQAASANRVALSAPVLSLLTWNTLLSGNYIATLVEKKLVVPLAKGNITAPRHSRPHQST